MKNSAIFSVCLFLLYRFNNRNRMNVFVLSGKQVKSDAIL